MHVKCNKSDALNKNKTKPPSDVQEEMRGGEGREGRRGEERVRRRREEEGREGDFFPPPPPSRSLSHSLALFFF